MPVDYEEIAPSPTGGWDILSGQWTGRRILKCTWTDRFNLLNEFLTWPGTPHSDNALALARGGTYRGIGKTVDSGDSKVLAWTHAEVIIVYGTPRAGDPVDAGGGSMVSEGIEASSEFLTLDHTAFRWDGPEGMLLNPNEAPGRMMIGFDYVFTRYNQPFVPDVVLDLLGHCNGDDIEAIFLGLHFNMETLRFSTLGINRRTTGSVNKIDYTMRFAFVAQGWNMFWNLRKEPEPGYSRLYIAGGGQYNNYPLATFGGTI